MAGETLDAGVATGLNVTAMNFPAGLTAGHALNVVCAPVTTVDLTW